MLRQTLCLLVILLVAVTKSYDTSTVRRPLLLPTWFNEGRHAAPLIARALDSPWTEQNWCIAGMNAKQGAIIPAPTNARPLW